MINDIFNNLSEQDKQSLLLAIEGDYTHIIRIDNALFLGVNVIPGYSTQIIQTEGAFTYGRLEPNES